MSESLDKLFSPPRIKRDATALAIWGCDWTRSFPVAPCAVVFPETIEEVRALVVLANEEGLQLVPSGGRTGLSGGAVASHGEVVVSFDRMNRILDFASADRLITCQAGVVTQTLQDFAARQGYFLSRGFRLGRIKSTRRQHCHQRRWNQSDSIWDDAQLDCRTACGHRNR